MKKLKPNVTIIGGIETGKTSTIQMLWENNVVDYECENGIHCFSIQEMLEGRGFVDFDVYELPRINYTSNEWIAKPRIKECLENSDVIVYVLTCDEVSISSRRAYLENLFNALELKKDVVFLIAYGMADWVLFPEVAKNFEIPENTEANLLAVSNLIKKISLVNSEFANFSRYDKTFSVASIIPYSNVIDWNLDELKYQIWNGIVVGLNELVFDETIPTIILSGKTGCGKTSTINALWGTNLATNRTASCTKFPAVMHIEDEYNGKKIAFNLVDLPGIAESMEANSLYRYFYYKYINKASLVLCLTQADRRAYKQDQLFYADLIANNILRQSQKVVLGINQADLLFKSADNMDGIDLHSISNDDEIIVSKINDFYNNIFSQIFMSFDNVTKESVAIYSVYQKWNLDILKNKLYALIF
jgi:small GTP-binding protein